MPLSHYVMLVSDRCGDCAICLPPKRLRGREADSDGLLFLRTEQKVLGYMMLVLRL